MMKKLGGVREAAEILAGLDSAARNRIIETIAEQNPELAEALKKNMVIFEDLQYITVNMLAELLREIDLKDLGMALRIGSPELREHILKNISSRMAQEITEILKGPPQPVPKVQDIVEKIMKVVRRKVEKGELILSKKGMDEYV